MTGPGINVREGPICRTVEDNARMLTAVVGYDDEEISRHLHPRLTTSILPHRAMGAWVVEQLGEFVPGQGRYPLVKLECPLVERDSVAKPKG